MSDLAQKKCVACEGGIPPLTAQKIDALLSEVEGWSLAGKKISKEFIFSNFQQVLDFVNRAGKIAEDEDHHPDLFLHDYKKLRIDIWTHAINGLSENDFILAAKIDAIPH